MILRLQVTPRAQGLCDITAKVRGLVAGVGMLDGLCTLYIQHTSASLLVQENYDSSARDDLESWMNRLVPEGDSLYTHTLEGADDMPAHIKAALTAVSISIPVIAGDLALGAWQGIFLWEHRHSPDERTVILHVA